MTTNLRDQTIAAMAQVLFVDKYPVREQRMTIHELVASYALDAALDVLADNADKWPCHEDIDGLDCICIPDLVGALRESE